MRLTARKFPYDGITQQVQRVTDGISLYLAGFPQHPYGVVRYLRSPLYHTRPQNARPNGKTFPAD